MLWYRAWLETRFRLLLSIGMLAPFLIPLRSIGIRNPTGVSSAAISAAYMVAWFSLFFAGAGIAAQSRKGRGRSTLFTVSLPVTRFRLVAARAMLGWVELAGVLGLMCLGMWALIPVVRNATGPAEMLTYTGALIACASGLYSVSVLLATFLDEIWRLYACAIIFSLLWWIPNHTPAPESVNIFGAMIEGSPLVRHTVPWLTIAFSLELSAIVLFAAWKVAQYREY